MQPKKKEKKSSSAINNTTVHEQARPNARVPLTETRTREGGERRDTETCAERQGQRGGNNKG